MLSYERFFFVEISYVSTHFTHKSLRSSINVYKKILIFTFKLFGPEKISEINKYGHVMHIFLGKLYGVTITGKH